MEQEKVKVLLEDWFGNLYPGDLGKGARKTYAKLKVRTEQRSMPTAGNYYNRARMVLKQQGNILEAEQDRRLLVAMGSGRNNGNPTLVEIFFEENSLQISAWAKEGWIPQKSVSLAISRCLEALKLNG